MPRYKLSKECVKGHHTTAKFWFALVKKSFGKVFFICSRNIGIEISFTALKQATVCAIKQATHPESHGRLKGFHKQNGERQFSKLQISTKSSMPSRQVSPHLQWKGDKRGFLPKILLILPMVTKDLVVKHLSVRSMNRIITCLGDLTSVCLFVVFMTHRYFTEVRVI